MRLVTVASTFGSLVCCKSYTQNATIPLDEHVVLSGQGQGRDSSGITNQKSTNPSNNRVYGKLSNHKSKRKLAVYSKQEKYKSKFHRTRESDGTKDSPSHVVAGHYHTINPQISFLDDSTTAQAQRRSAKEQRTITVEVRQINRTVILTSPMIITPAEEASAPSVSPSTSNGLRKGKNPTISSRSKMMTYPSISPTSLSEMYPTSEPSTWTFAPSRHINSETQKPSSNPSHQRRFKKVNKITSTSVTLAPIDKKMDATIISIYEAVVKHFILDTMKVPKGIKIRVKSVEVQSQYLDHEELPTTRLLQQSDLSVMMDISGNIGFTELGPNFRFEDAILYGLRNNWTLFVDRLIDSSSFFETLQEQEISGFVNESIEESIEESIDTENIRIKPHDIIMLVSFSFVIVVSIIWLVRDRRKFRYELDDDESINSCLAVADQSVHKEYPEREQGGNKQLNNRSKSEYQTSGRYLHNDCRFDDVSSLGSFDQIDSVPVVMYEGVPHGGRGVISNEICNPSEEEHDCMTDSNSCFAAGDKLVELRLNISRMQGKLRYAMMFKFQHSTSVLSSAISSAMSRDPFLVYEQSKMEYSQAINEGEMEKAAKIYRTVMSSRRCIPHLNLNGTWICENGDSYNIVYITYAGGYMGDCLVARNLTGNKSTQQQNIADGGIILQIPMNPGQNTIDTETKSLNFGGSQIKSSSAAVAETFLGKCRIFSNVWREGIFHLRSQDQFIFCITESGLEFVFERHPIAGL